jgi:hypothetical protein
VDVATLTGAIWNALGEIASGVFSNDDTLAREVVQPGDSAWDRAWYMPLWREYQDTFKSNIAGFANVSPRGDCAITAACFLSRHRALSAGARRHRGNGVDGRRGKRRHGQAGGAPCAFPRRPCRRLSGNHFRRCTRERTAPAKRPSPSALCVCIDADR